jgi:hypothetical protein
MTKATQNLTPPAAGEARNIIPRVVAALAVVFSVLLFSAAAAGSEPYTHDGLHFRFGIGVVAGWNSLEEEDNKVTFSGPGILDGVQLGGTPVENLTLFVEADALTLLPVNKNVGNATETELAEDENDASFTFMTGVGAGYYFTPSNIYVSGAVGASFNNLTIADEGVVLDTRDIGIGFSLMVAKEWWVAEDWSAGFAGQFLFTAARGEGSDYMTQTVAGGLLLTASHN